MHYKQILHNTINLKIQIRNTLEIRSIYYWSPFLTPIATCKAVINSAYSIKKFGHDFDCSILNFFGEFDENLNEIKSKNLKVKNHYEFNFTKYLPKYGKIFSRTSFIIFFLLGFFPLLNILKRQKPNYLIIHLITSLPLFLLIIFNFRTKFILRISGLPRLSFFRKLIWKLAFKKIHAVTCPTNATYNYIKNLKIVDEKKLKILYDPILEVRKIQIKKKQKINLNTKYFLAVGRLTKQKNFLFLCKGFNKILSSNPELKLFIVGEGEEYKKLNNYIISHKLEKKIELLDYKENIFPYLINSKGFILTSLWEDPGFVLIEAAFCRVPVYTSDSKPGPSELIKDNFNGTTFVNNNLNSFVDKFDLFINNSKNKNILLENLKYSKKFTLFNHYKLLNKFI